MQKLRSEKVERSFAHLYKTRGMRRVPLRGRRNILKRLLVQGAAFNLSLILRITLDAGKPRQWQALFCALRTLGTALLVAFSDVLDWTTGTKVVLPQNDCERGLNFPGCPIYAVG